MFAAPTRSILISAWGRVTSLHRDEMWPSCLCNFAHPRTVFFEREYGQRHFMVMKREITTHVREWDGPAVLPPRTAQRMTGGLRSTRSTSLCPIRQPLQSLTPSLRADISAVQTCG